MNSSSRDTSSSSGSAGTNSTPSVTFSEITKLNISGLKLYGRVDEMRLLQDIHHRVSQEGACCEAIILEGYSGTGKSTLVENFRLQLDNGIFVSGKFDEFRVMEPYSALAVAMNELCDEILESEEKVKEQTSAAMRKAVGSEGQVLMNVIPQLRNIVGDPGEATEVIGNAEALNRLLFVFRNFVRAVCTHCHASRPLVVFLDDLQWADASSLELIKALVTDTQLTNFLFIGAYRDNEVEEGHVLKKTLQEIDDHHKTILHRMTVGNLGQDTVNELLSDIMRLDPSATQPLAKLIHQRTHGNMFFVLQFLDLLQGDGYLTFSVMSYKWGWNIERIRAETNVSDNVVQVVAGKIQKLPEQVQFLLKISACIWSTIDADILETVVKQVIVEGEEGTGLAIRTKEDILRILDVAAGESLVEKCSDDGMRYRFVHDRIQQAAYSLVAEGKERDELHLKIGKAIWEHIGTYKGSKEVMLFIAAYQLNRGSRCITDHNDRVSLAKLNLEVADMAMFLSAVVPAAEYLQYGLDLLTNQEESWKENYQLNLLLHNASAEMELRNGRIEQSTRVVNTVLANAQCLEDKLKAYFVLIDSLYSQQRKFEEAMEIGLDLLSQLGERFPRRANMLHIIRDLIKTKRMVRKLTDNDFMTLQPMHDDKKVAAMKVIHSLITCAFWSHKGTLFVLLILRMMQLTIQLGETKLGPYAFVSYGVILCSLGDYEGAYRFGKLAFKLLEKLNARECVANITNLTNSFIFPWQDPLQDSLDPLLDGYKAGMACGDIEHAIYCASSYTHNYLYCGLPLAPLEKDFRDYCAQMIEYKQETVYYGNLPYWQYVSNLLNRSEDPLVMTGVAMEQEEFIKNCKQRHDLPSMQIYWLHRLQLAYYFGDMELALEMAEEFRKKTKNIEGHFIYSIFVFFDGLLSLELLAMTSRSKDPNKRKKRKHKSHAIKCITKMHKWVKAKVTNCLHKLMLLEAEFASIAHLTKKSDNPDHVKELFDLAIKTARRSGFLQDAALACERAGVFFLSNHGDNNRYWAISYLDNSHKWYCEWGATAKAAHLQTKYASVMTSPRQRRLSFSTAFKGKQRFSKDATTMHKRLSIEDIERSSQELGGSSSTMFALDSAEFHNLSLFGSSRGSSSEVLSEPSSERTSRDEAFINSSLELEPDTYKRRLSQEDVFMRSSILRSDACLWEVPTERSSEEQFPSSTSFGGS